MGLMWFCVGLITGLSAFVATGLHRRFELDWRAWGALATGMGMLLFSIAWSVASVAEGEPRAATMGVMLFGAPGVAILALAVRLLVLPARRPTEA